MLRKYWKFLVAALVGVLIAVCSWYFIVEPSYPYLLLDKDSPVIDDSTGIGYLPIEMTGASSDGAIVKHMCNVPEIYVKYVHNMPKESNIMSSESGVGKFMLMYSWQIVVGMLIVLAVYIMYSKWRKQRKEPKA